MIEWDRLRSRRKFCGTLFGAMLPPLLPIAALASAGCGTPVRVYLVRHAEKQPLGPGIPDKDPPLSEKGIRRAAGLKQAMAPIKLAAIFATQFKRTQATVEPTAKAHNLKPQIFNADDIAGVVLAIRQHPGENVLVAGHSNTVPAIAAALGASDSLALDDADFGDLFVVTGESGWVNHGRFEPA